MNTYRANEIVNTSWTWSEDRYNANEVIDRACLLVLARNSERIASALESLASDARSLGRDGIHDLVRVHSKRAQRAEQKQVERRRKRIRLARKRKVA